MSGPPSLRGSPAHAQPSLFTGMQCAECIAHDRCGAVGTVHACASPCEHTGRVHPATSPLASNSTLDLPLLSSWPRVPSLGQTLIVADTKFLDHADALRLPDVVTALRTGGLAPTRLAGKFAVLQGKDTTLARLWAIRGRLPVFMKEAGFAGVIGPGYSTWDSDSPFASLVAMTRSATVATDLAEVLATIPTLVWRFDRDLEVWAEWVATQRVPVIAVDLGTFRREDWWTWAVESLAYLNQQLAKASCVPALVVSGPSTRRRIADVLEAWSSTVTFASSRPWSLACHGRRWGRDLDKPETAPWMTRPGLLEVNAAALDAAVRALATSTARTVA